MAKRKKGTTLHKLFGISARSLTKNIRSSKKLKSSTIHDLRVDIKHLRTILYLIAEFNKNAKAIPDLLRKIKRVFKSAGEIRTAYLNIKLLRKVKGTAEYIRHLEQQSSIGNKAFLSALKDFDRTGFKKTCKKVHKLIRPVKRSQVIDEALKFIHKKELFIKRAKDKKMTAALLHTIRKELKNIKATTQVLYKVTRLKEFNVNAKTLTILEESIGEWHDLDVLLSGMTTFMKERSIGSNFKSHIKAYAQKENKMRREVLLLLHKHFE